MPFGEKSMLYQKLQLLHIEMGMQAALNEISTTEVSCNALMSIPLHKKNPKNSTRLRHGRSAQISSPLQRHIGRIAYRIGGALAVALRRSFGCLVEDLNDLCAIITV